MSEYCFPSKMRGKMWSKGLLVPHDNLPIGMCGCNDYWKPNSKGELTGGWCDCRARKAAIIAHNKRTSRKLHGLERRATTSL